MKIQVQEDYYKAERYTSLERFISYFHQVLSVRELPVKSILFIGVGDMLVIDLLRKKYQVTTVDIDPNLKPNIVADIRSLPVKNASFDLVCVFEVLEHIPPGDVAGALKEIARVSKTYAVISVPHRRTGLELVFKFPFIRSLLKRDFVRIALLVPVKFPGFAISGQHYWEIDGRSTSLKYFRKVLSERFHIEKEKTAPLDPYRRFFYLKKKSRIISMTSFIKNS